MQVPGSARLFRSGLAAERKSYCMKTCGRKAKHSDLVTSRIRWNKPVLQWYLPTTGPYPLTLEVLSRYANHSFWLGLCDICKNLPALSGTQPQVPFDIPQVAAHITGKMLDQSYRVAEPSWSPSKEPRWSVQWHRGGCITWKSPWIHELLVVTSWISLHPNLPQNPSAVTISNQHDQHPIPTSIPSDVRSSSSFREGLLQSQQHEA